MMENNIFDTTFNKLLNESCASDTEESVTLATGATYAPDTEDCISLATCATRAKPFTLTEKKLLVQIINQVDKKKILASSSRSADIRNRKANLWSEIVSSFNQGCGRSEEITQVQIMNLAKSIKKSAREKSDQACQQRAFHFTRKNVQRQEEESRLKNQRICTMMKVVWTPHIKMMLVLLSITI